LLILILRVLILRRSLVVLRWCFLLLGLLGALDALVLHGGGARRGLLAFGIGLARGLSVGVGLAVGVAGDGSHVGGGGVVVGVGRRDLRGGDGEDGQGENYGWEEI
jgi:hypothetical protein